MRSLNLNGAFFVFIYLLLSFLLVIISIARPTIGLLGSISIVLVLLYLGFLSKKLTLYHYIYLLIISVVLSPMIDFSFMPADLRLDDLWLVFGGTVLLTKITLSKGNPSFSFPSYAKIFSIFIVWIVITISLTAFNDPTSYSNRDWTEVYKNGKLLIYLLIATNLKVNNEKINKIVNVVIVSLLISSFFGIAQYFNLVNVNSWLTPHYIYESRIYNLETQGRVVGTFGNPNTFGIALMIGIALTFSKLLAKYKMRYVLSIFIFFIASILTLSRTALVISVILLAYIFLLSIKEHKNLLKPLLFIATMPVVILVGLRLAPDYYFYRISFLSDISQDNSFRGRLNNWEFIWDNFVKDNFFIGTGATSHLSLTFDNEWLMLLTYYGLIGLFLFVCVFGFIYLKIIKNRTQVNMQITIAARGLIVAFAISMFVTAVYHLLQVMPIIIIVIGLALNKNVNANNEVAESSRETIKKKRKRYKLVW